MSLIYEEVSYKAQMRNVKRFLRTRKITDLVTELQPTETMKTSLKNMKQLNAFIKAYERTITNLVRDPKIKDLLRQTALYAFNYERHMKHMQLLQDYVFLAKNAPVVLRTNTDSEDVDDILKYFGSGMFAQINNNNMKLDILATAYFILIDSDRSHEQLKLCFLKTQICMTKLNCAIKHYKCPVEIESCKTTLEESIEQLFQVSLESVKNQDDKDGLEDYTIDDVVNSFNEHIASYDLQCKLYDYKTKFYNWLLKNCTIFENEYEYILNVLSSFLKYRENRGKEDVIVKQCKIKLVGNVKSLVKRFRSDVFKGRERNLDESLYAKFVRGVARDFLR